MVEGLDKIATIKPKDTRLEAENYKKLIVQYSTDPRVTVLKIADRLEVMRHLEPPFDREKAETFLHHAGLTEPPLVYAAEASGDFIGYVIYHAYDADSVEIGWVLLPEYWGRGYASALTDRLIDQALQERKSVVIECAPAQEATKRIASKKGFRDCGICDGLALYRLP